MRRRLTPADIHPSIFDAIHAAASEGMNASTGVMTSAYSKFSSVWMEEYWKGFVLWLMGLIPAIGVPLALKGDLGKGGTGLAILGFMVIWMVVGAALYRRNKNMVIWEEIEALRPMLKISESQGNYLDCVKAVLDSRVLDESQKGSWLASLNASLDQAMQLEKIYGDMRISLGGNSANEMQSERDKLEARMNAATDPVGKEIFRQSLEMADERMRRSDGLAGQSERAEAHLELTRQTFLRTRETLMGMDIGSRQTTQIDLEPLRANLARVQDEAHAIRTAIDELAQIRTEL